MDTPRKSLSELSEKIEKDRILIGYIIIFVGALLILGVGFAIGVGIKGFIISGVLFGLLFVAPGGFVVFMSALARSRHLRALGDPASVTSLARSFVVTRPGSEVVEHRIEVHHKYHWQPALLVETIFRSEVNEPSPAWDELTLRFPRVPVVA